MSRSVSHARRTSGATGQQATGRAPRGCLARLGYAAMQKKMRAMDFGRPINARKLLAMTKLPEEG
jgi:hypothetical protein